MRCRSLLSDRPLPMSIVIRFSFLEEDGHRVILRITPYALSKGGSSGEAIPPNAGLRCHEALCLSTAAEC